MLFEWRRGIARLFGIVARRPDAIRRDADDELAALFAARVERLMAQGMTEDDARDEAIRRLGGSIDAARDDLRRSAARRERIMGVREWFVDLTSDAQYALRGLRREPVFSGFVVLTLALGIGANAAMFGVVDKLLLRGPAHVRDANRIVRLYWTMRTPIGVDETVVQFDTRIYPNLYAEAHAFSGVVMYTRAGRFFRFGEGDAARLLASASATANLMSVLGAPLVAGRFFTLDEQANGSPVVVLGYDLWQGDFGGDRGVVGRTVRLSDRPYVVVGIAPRGFTGPELERVDVWFPLRAPLDAAARRWGTGHSSGPLMVARLKSGVTYEAAGADATDAHRRTYDGTQHEYAEGRLSVGPLHYGPGGSESTEASISRWLVGVSVIVLLVACANIANLLLARAVRRRREMAVRLAMGAGRARLMRMLLTGSIVLALLGGLGALAVARVAGGIARRVLLPDVDWTSGPVDSRVLGFSFAVALATGLVIGVLPAWRAGRADITSALKAGAREGGGNRSVLRGALTLAQASLAMVLLIGAGLFVRSFHRVRHVDLGIQPDRVLLLSPRWAPLPAETPARDREAERQRQSDFARSVVDRVASQPSVERVAFSIGLPFTSSATVDLYVPGWDSLPPLKGDGMWAPRVSAVSADYFATVGTRILQGRAFTAADRAGSEPVAIVNATMASTLWPGKSALGQCIRMGGRSAPCSRIVGVAQDSRRRSIREDPYRHYYVPVGQEVSISGLQLLVRPRGDAAAAIPALSALLRQIDPQIRYVDANVLQARVDPQMRSWRLGAMMFSLFAGLALVVAAVGMFSVVAYLVEQRRHEIGVRIALGARASDIVSLMLRGAVTMAALGVVLGTTIALVAGRFAQPLLFETDAHDPAILGIGAVMLVVVAALASGVPALRARTVDPMTALRDE